MSYEIECTCSTIVSIDPQINKFRHPAVCENCGVEYFQRRKRPR